FAFLTSFELSTYFGKEIAHQRDRSEEIKRLFGEMATTALVGLALSFVVLTCLLIFYKKIDAPLLLISSIGGITFGFEKNLSGVLLGKEKMHFEFITQLVAFVLVAVPVFFAVRHLDITGIYFLRIAASLVCIGLRGYFTRIAKYLEKKRVSLKQYNWKEIGFFSASGFTAFVQHHIDLFILSFFISKELEGAYFLALRIFLAFNLMAEMISFALTPFISRTYRGKDADTFDLFYARLFKVQVGLGAAASVILFFTRDYMVALFSKGKSSALASDFLLYFSFFLFFRFVSYYTGNVLTSTRFQHIRFYILITSAVLLVVLEVILVIFFSAYGAIYARAVMEIFIFIAYLTAVTKIRGKPVSPVDAMNSKI
ncbi:MAG: oligosaccharide flippase family protein, partial [bacterium]|nr:oligosaccharide flippase family protein [bacterium]